MENLIKPPRLCVGDKVAAISLSWGGPGTFPYRYEVGKQRLETVFGVRVVPTAHALKPPEWIHQNPEARANDLMEAFRDPTIKGIFATIGGEDSIRLLPFVDLKVIATNPKLFIGFSDSTVTHFMCLKAGVSSFYGPSIMTSFAENVQMHQYTTEGVRRVLFSNEIIGVIPENSEGWTNEMLDWAEPSNQQVSRQLRPPMRLNLIGNRDKVTRGRLLGGCVEVLQMISGTTIWPEDEMWDGCIFFMETSEDGMSVSSFTYFLRNLAARGILGKMSGILFGRPGGHSVEEEKFKDYDNAILGIFEEFGIPPIPVVTRMNFGHSDPMWILPYGCLTEINPVTQTVTLLENGAS